MPLAEIKNAIYGRQVRARLKKSHEKIIYAFPLVRPSNANVPRVVLEKKAYRSCFIENVMLFLVGGLNVTRHFYKRIFPLKFRDFFISLRTWIYDFDEIFVPQYI